MTAEDPLTRMLALLDIEGGAGFDEESADELVGKLGFDSGTGVEFENALVAFADWDSQSPIDGELELRLGRWHLDLKKEGMRAALMSAVIGATLMAYDVELAGVAVVAAVVPSLLEIEDVSISDGDNRLLLDVRRLPEVTTELLDVDALYERLPADVRAVVNRFDFADFVQRLRDSDLAEMGPDGSTVRIRGDQERVPKIRWC